MYDNLVHDPKSITSSFLPPTRGVGKTETVSPSLEIVVTEWITVDLKNLNRGLLAGVKWGGRFAKFFALLLKEKDNIPSPSFCRQCGLDTTNTETRILRSQKDQENPRSPVLIKVRCWPTPVTANLSFSLCQKINLYLFKPHVSECLFNYRQ